MMLLNGIIIFADVGWSIEVFKTARKSTDCGRHRECIYITFVLYMLCCENLSSFLSSIFSLVNMSGRLGLRVPILGCCG